MYKSLSSSLFRLPSIANTHQMCIRYIPLSSKSAFKRTFSVAADETNRLKMKLPIYRVDAEPSEIVSIGKLREDLHSVAICRLDFVKIEDVLSMPAEDLQHVVVVPKVEKLTVNQRIEKLEAEVEQFHKSLSSSKEHQ